MALTADLEVSFWPSLKKNAKCIAPFSARRSDRTGLGISPNHGQVQVAFFCSGEKCTLMRNLLQVWTPSRAPRRLSPTHADHHRPCAPRWSRDSARGQRSRCTAPACACSPLASATRRTHLQHALAGATPRDTALPVSRGLLTTHHARWQATRLNMALLSKPTRARASPSSSSVIDGHFVPALRLLLSPGAAGRPERAHQALQLPTRTRHRVVCSWIRVPCILHFAFCIFARCIFYVRSCHFCLLLID